MDLDTLVNLLILFAFFVLPSLLRRRKIKKQKRAAAQAQDQVQPDQVPAKKRKKKKAGKKGRFNLFGKLADRIREFRQELERQVQLARQEQEKQENDAWKDLSRDDEADFQEAEFSSPEEPSPGQEPGFSTEEPVPPFLPSSEKHDGPRAMEAVPGSAPDKIHVPAGTAPDQPASVSPQALRNAVIWSEILGKPVSLKEN